MEMEMFWTIVGVVVSFAGIAYGWYQDRLRSQIQRLSTMQAWEVYQSSRQVIGWMNEAFEEEVDAQTKDQLLREARVRADDHYMRTIYNLYTHYDNVTPQLVRKWIDEGRIEE